LSEDSSNQLLNFLTKYSVLLRNCHLLSTIIPDSILITDNKSNNQSRCTNIWHQNKQTVKNNSKNWESTSNGHKILSNVLDSSPRFFSFLLVLSAFIAHVACWADIDIATFIQNHLSSYCYCTRTSVCPISNIRCLYISKTLQAWASHFKKRFYQKWKTQEKILVVEKKKLNLWKI
jgi:hypothetical protein